MVRRLVLLNGLAVLGAVVHHSVGWVVTAIVWWADRYRPVTIPDYSQIGTPAFYGLALVDQVAIFGVPAFLFVSGFFVSIATGPSQRTIGWKVVFARIQTLAIPYLFWTVVILAFNIFDGMRYDIVDLIWIFLAGTVDAPFYYVPLLIQLYLLTPFIVPFARKWWKPMLVISILLYIPVAIFEYMALTHIKTPDSLEAIRYVFLKWRVLEFNFWFVLGIAVGFHLDAFKAMISRWRRYFLGGAMLSLIIAVTEWGFLRQSYGHEWISPQDTFSSKVFVLLALLSFLAFDQLKFPFSSTLRNLGVKSYGIYLTHFLILELTARAVAVLLPALLAYSLIFQLILVLAGTAIPSMLMTMVNRSPAKRFYRYVFG